MTSANETNAIKRDREHLKYKLLERIDVERYNNTAASAPVVETGAWCGGKEKGLTTAQDIIKEVLDNK